MAINSGERGDELQVDDDICGQQWWTETVDGQVQQWWVRQRSAHLTRLRSKNDAQKVLNDMTTSAWRWTIKHEMKNERITNNLHKKGSKMT
jgi:hypothetical protein